MEFKLRDQKNSCCSFFLLCCDRAATSLRPVCGQSATSLRPVCDLKPGCDPSATSLRPVCDQSAASLWWSVFLFSVLFFTFVACEHHNMDFCNPFMIFVLCISFIHNHVLSHARPFRPNAAVLSPVLRASVNHPTLAVNDPGVGYGIVYLFPIHIGPFCLMET